MYDKKEMFQATCSECGNECEVPFKPTGEKPVLCSTCFGQQKDKQQGRQGGRGQGRSGDRQMYSAVCNKCGNKAEVPFKPSGDKPIFCSDCFKKEDRHGGGRGGDRHGGRERGGGMARQLSEQLKSLSIKVDKVLDLLETGTTKKKSPTKVTTKKPEDKKKATKKVTKKSVKKVVKKKK